MKYFALGIVNKLLYTKDLPPPTIDGIKISEILLRLVIDIQMSLKIGRITRGTT